MEINDAASVQLFSQALQTEKMMKTGIIDRTLEYSHQSSYSSREAARAADQDFQVTVLSSAATGKGGKVDMKV